EEILDADNRAVRARNYPWGYVEVDNEDHSDFDRLRYVLLNSHIGDLREITHNVIYENYRTEKLSNEDDEDEEEDEEEEEERVANVGLKVAA
ncbi:Cell division control protein 3, partial [Smittium culicis]